LLLLLLLKSLSDEDDSNNNNNTNINTDSQSDPTILSPNHERRKKGMKKVEFVFGSE